MWKKIRMIIGDEHEGTAAHLANFDKKVHKPQYCTLVIARVKKAKHAEKLSNYLVSK